jgi:hypothetical protein
MAAAKLSKAVQGILEALVANSGDNEIDAGAAEKIWGGSKATKVKDLTQTQLLQLALIDAHKVITGLYEQNEQLLGYVEKLTTPNRETRRSKKLWSPK